MPEDDFPSSVPPSGAPPQHTTGGGMKWTPPSPEHLQRMLPAFEITAMIGRGGMGAVYSGMQRTLRRPVAIKIVPPEAADDEAQFIARFQNEALTMAKLNHPAIVSVYDFGETEEGQLFFAMEFVDGTDVAQMIKAQGKLPPEHALAITAHVCDALTYAHGNGVIHRDIKPANILINQAGQVKVADFGLAKLEDPSLTSGLTKSHMAMGTPDFVAPEMLTMGVVADHRADLYAIGVMLYQMLTGEIPRGMFQMPSEKVGSDPRFDAIIRRAMESDRERRYQSAAEIRADLDAILTTPLAKAAQQQPPHKPVSRGPQREGSTGNPARHPEADKSVRAPARPKSKAGLFYGLGAAAALAVGAFLFLGGKEKPKPAPAAVAATTPKPKPAPPSPKPASITPAAPPKPAIATAAPAPAFTEPVPVLTAKALDLLPGIDLGLDKVGGKWSRSGDAISYDSRSGDLNARLQIPVQATGGYTLEVELSAKPKAGDVVLFLPFAKGDGDALQNTAFIVHHDNKGAHRAGFVHFHGKGGFARDTPGWVNTDTPLGAGSRITVQVLEPKPGGLALKAWVNGKPLVAWEGPRSETTGGTATWRPSRQGWFAVGTTEEGTVFHRVRLEAVEGEVTWLREPAKLATAPVPAAPPTMAPAASTPQPPAADPVSQRLASLEKQFLEAYEKQAGAAHKAAVADLNAKFGAALDRSVAAASQAGKLEEALALRNEKTLIQTSGAVPESDDESTPDTLKTLRKTWRQQMAALLAKREQAAAPVHAGYDRLLAAYQDELTKAQQLDAAARVKAVRDHAATQREAAAPPAPDTSSTAAATTPSTVPVGSSGKTPVPVAPVMPPLPADKVLPPPPPATQEEIRALCEWALQKDGKVELKVNQQGVTFTNGETLPGGKLTLIGFSVYDLSFEKPEEAKWFSILGRVPELEWIFFHKNPGTMPMEQLRGATKLKSLRLTPATVDDAAFAHLTGLKNLESLQITYMVKQFTGTGLGYLNPNLQELSTNSPTLTAEGLAQLPRFKKLKKLTITGDSLGGRSSTITDAMLSGLAALTELEELDLSERAGLDGSFLTHLPPNSKLKSLFLPSMKDFKPEHLKHLAKLKNLEELSLPPVDVSPEVASILAGLGQLRVLTLNLNTVFTGESLKNVKGFRSLRDLDVNVCPLTDAGLEAIANAMPELFLFRMSMEKRSKATITPQGFSQAFRRLGKLASLQFNGEKITDEWLQHIAQLKAVDYLMLTGAQITDQGLAPLMKLPLGYLRLDGTAVTDAVIPILKNCPTLNNVPVSGTKMTDAGKQELQKMLEANKAAR